MIEFINILYVFWYIVLVDYKKMSWIEVFKIIIRKCEEVLWGVKMY